MTTWLIPRTTTLRVLLTLAVASSAPELARAQAAAMDSRMDPRADSINMLHQQRMQPLLRVIELDSALAMSALPRLSLDATRDLARATVLNHRAMGDSLRSAAWRQHPLGAFRTRYASHLENEARHRLRLGHADTDLSYVINAIALQKSALRLLDAELNSAVQDDTMRRHITTARQQTLERLEYAERLRSALVGAPRR